MSKGTISKWAKKAMNEGWLRKKGREYVFVEGNRETSFRLLTSRRRKRRETKISDLRFHISGARFRSFRVGFPALRVKEAFRFLLRFLAVSYRCCSFLVSCL